MAIVFSDNFDGESEGTSPPANWTESPTKTPLNCEVDDVQAHSSPHSMWIKANSSSYDRVYHDEASGFTDDKITIWLYFDNTTKSRQILTQDTIGDYLSTQVAARIAFETNGDIRYYDGIWNDTGYDYTTGWHKIEIVHDVDADTFDCWYDDVQIINNGGFQNVADSIKNILSIVGDSGNLWVDDVQIGSSGWSGKVLGVSNPAKILGASKDNIVKVDGVSSS